GIRCRRVGKRGTWTCTGLATRASSSSWAWTAARRCCGWWNGRSAGPARCRRRTWKYGWITPEADAAHDLKPAATRESRGSGGSGVLPRLMARLRHTPERFPKDVATGAGFQREKYLHSAAGNA